MIALSNPPDELDKQLTERMLAGDRAALAELVNLHRSRLLHLLRSKLDRRLRGRIDPADVLQEMYVAASQRLDNYRDNPRLSAFVWLREIAFQRLVDLHRRHVIAQKRSARMETSLEHRSRALAEQLIDEGIGPALEIDRNEQFARLHRVLRSMRPFDRQVLVLRHFENMTNDEVASAMQLTKSGASNRYSRALTRLKSALESDPIFRDEP